MTVGELLTVALAKRREEWERWSQLYAAVANGACTKKGGGIWVAEDFNPYPKPKQASQAYIKVSPSEFIDSLTR